MCQFDFRPLKAGNCLELCACRWRAIYPWKALDEGYNFAQLEVYIRSYGLPKWQKSQFREFRNTRFGSFKEKWHLSVVSSSEI